MEKDEATWKVTELEYQQTLPWEQLTIGNDYGVFVPEAGKICRFKLVKVDLDSGEYCFRALDGEHQDRVVRRQNSPSIYPIDTPANAHGSVTAVVLKCVDTRGAEPRVETLPLRSIARKKFALDVGFTHVFECIGKPKESDTHLCITTYEPYGVACLQGLKVSYGMHNFGEKRFGSGLLDDLRSINDQNTRIIGDFTKMVRVKKFVRGIYEAVSKDKNWELQFQALVKESKFPDLDGWDPLMPKIVSACRQLADDAPKWRRKTVQTRFFETGDNYYLGMEFTREYDAWKEDLGDQLVGYLRARNRDGTQEKDINNFRALLMSYIDRLWYEGVLETIRKGDVYNPGARKRVPRLYLINSHIPQKLSELPELEAFRLVNEPAKLYEIIIIEGSKYVCRTVEGHIKIFTGQETVKRESNLTRGPDGNSESKVCLASFPVGHYVNHRTMVKSKHDFVFAFGGDEQSTPHFMRYSGLTGACINAMTFNVFLSKALIGVDFKTRFSEYSQETQWSNGEVVQRGTGANYGEDGFLRPGFPYRAGVNYLWDKLTEYKETGQDTEDILSYDWKVKFAAALIPRGLEYNNIYLETLKLEWHKNVLARFVDILERYPTITAETKEMVLRTNDITPNKDDFWSKVESDILPLQGFHGARIYKICQQIIDFAQFLRSEDLRISSSLFHQTAPVDVVIDDFVVEAQNVANALTQSAALAAATLGLRLVNTEASNIFAAILAAFNIVISFGTMTNIARYKTRNEEARTNFFHKGYHKVEKAVFSLMSDHARRSVALDKNPFYKELENTVAILRDQFKYYNIKDPQAFDRAYDKLKSSRFDDNAILEFQHMLLTDFLAVRYYVNSYVQESLVHVYKTTQEILTFERPGPHGQREAEELFEKLVQFKPFLKKTLQEGDIRWGFVKKRKMSHWDIFSALSWLRSLMYQQRVDRPIGSAPVEIETRGLAENLKTLSNMNGKTILHREQLDFETLFWAHRESQVASMVFVTGFLVFVSSVVFTIGRIFRVDVLIDISFWAALPSTMGALLAAFHLFRKYGLLSGLYQKIKAKRNTAVDSDSRDSFSVVLSATSHQMSLTVIRFFTAVAAAVTLPWAIAANQFDKGDDAMGDDSDFQIPSILGTISVSCGIVSVIYFFVVEYVIRYNLPVNLGPFICRIISDEIQSTYEEMRAPSNGIDSSKKEERDRWHYTARKVLHEYRFDTVFAADRFGQILQTIQGGVDPVDFLKGQTYV
uniref:Uncharacterized protein n=1 Tax=Amphora coffeiformis TaxID=265554 RepID=A0A7S3L929_9STRA